MNATSPMGRSPSMNHAANDSRIGNTYSDDGRLEIVFRPEDRTQHAHDIENEIVRATEIGQYVSFGGLLCHVAERQLPYTRSHEDGNADAPPVLQIVPLDEVAVLAHAEKVVKLIRMLKAGPRAIAIPPMIVEIIIKKKRHAAPMVTGLLTHPIVLPDGSILARPGLHEPTGLLLCGGGLIRAKSYSQAEAREAWARLRHLVLEGFEFASRLDEDAALAALVTMIQRRVLDLAPGFAFLANTQASGKTTLARRLHVIVSGQDMPVSTFAEGDEAEIAKRLLSALMRSPEVICFDNLTDGTTFRSSSIAAAMTGPSYSQRLLGSSLDVEVPTNTTFIITGNNLSLGADEVSRWLVSWLSPSVEKPEERQFAIQDIVGHALKIREEVMNLVIGIVSGYLKSGEQMATATRFSAWDRMVRQAMIWAGASDMGEAFRRNADNSEDLQAHQALLTVLHELFGFKEFLASDVASRAKEGLNNVQTRACSAGRWAATARLL